MKTRYLHLFLGSVLALSLFGCSLNDDIDYLKREIKDLRKELKEKENQGESKLPFIKLSLDEGKKNMAFYPGQTITVKVEADGISSIGIDEPIPAGWSATYDSERQELSVTSPSEMFEGEKRISISGVNANGQVHKAILVCTPRVIDTLDPYGVFVLNEGSVWSKPSELSTLIYLTPDKHIIADAYGLFNSLPIGACSQDMVGYEGKLYVIAQNKDDKSDGRLTIIDGRTMKKVVNYASELDILSWPTHLAVIDDKSIFIRDNKGLYRFDTTTKTLTFVEGTEGARKNTMPVVSGKAFVTLDDQLLVLTSGADKVEKIITFDDNISGVVPADDKSLYVSMTGEEDGKNVGIICKVSAEDYSIIKKNVIEGNDNEILTKTFTATPSITAKGDTLYYSGISSTIYRHIFSTGATKKMIDTKSINPTHSLS